MNGLSLPQKKEIAIAMGSLNRIEIQTKGTVIADGGVVIGELQEFLKTKGLRVGKGGWPMGPTIGGLISAGGIGNAPFWNFVLEISLITMAGEILVIKRNDPLFPWIFGSMGQLGVIGKAKLKTETIKEEKYRQRVPPSYSGERAAWFSLFLPPNSEIFAAEDLADLCLKYRDFWSFQGIFRYYYPFQEFNPPLVYPLAESFLALGIWGYPRNHSHFDPVLIEKIASDFHEIVLEYPTFKRYIQIEWHPKKMDYRKYFGEEIYSQFLKLKLQLDPNNLLNSKNIFDTSK